MWWKSLFAVLLGLLMVGGAMAGVPTYKTSDQSGGISENSTPPGENWLKFGGKLKYFYGDDVKKAFGQKEVFKLPIEFIPESNVSEITFVGIYTDRYGRVYYHIVEGPIAKDTAINEFKQNVRLFSFRPLSKTVTVMGRSRNWEDIGAISWKKVSTGTTLEMGITAEFSCVETRSGMVYYLVEIHQTGNPKRDDIAVDEMNVKVEVPESVSSYSVWISRWLPEMDGGPKRYYSYSSTINLEENSLSYSASAGYSEETNDGLTFRWKVKIQELGRDVKFVHYDFREKMFWWFSRPAYGKVFDANPSIIVVSRRNEALLSFRADAEFNLAGRMFAPVGPIGFKVRVTPDTVKELS